MNFVTHQFKITGILPLLTHNPASMRAASTAPKTKKIPTREEEVEAGLYRDKRGNCCLPSIAFRSAFLNGLKNKRVGKASAISVLQPAVLPADEFTIILNQKTGKPFKSYEEIDERRAVVQRQGIIRHRPKFINWGCVLSLNIDEDSVPIEHIEEHLNNAGTVIGVGDFRVEKKGTFGTFTAKLLSGKGE